MTDLTGTSWLFNESLDITTSATYNINFNSNNLTFTKIEIKTNRGGAMDYYNGTSWLGGVYDAGSWQDAGLYHEIEITGGTDATNATLISWLQANATQLVSAPTIAEQLITLNGVKQDIKAAIAAKHVVMDGVPFTNYPAKVDEISTGIDSEAAYAALIAATYPTGGGSMTGYTVSITHGDPYAWESLSCHGYDDNGSAVIIHSGETKELIVTTGIVIIDIGSDSSASNIVGNLTYNSGPISGRLAVASNGSITITPFGGIM